MGDLIRCRQTFELSSTVVIAASLSCYQYRQFKTGKGPTRWLAIGWEPARRADIQLVNIII